jgi:hypothetical protein
MWKDFISKNTDKLLVVAVLVMFYGGSWYGFKAENPNFANASIDLAKQLAAAFLTLTVSSRMTTNTRSTDTGDTNGSAKTNSTTPSGNSSSSTVTS